MGQLCSQKDHLWPMGAGHGWVLKPPGQVAATLWKGTQGESISGQCTGSWQSSRGWSEGLQQRQSGCKAEAGTRESLWGGVDQTAGPPFQERP